MANNEDNGEDRGLSAERTRAGGGRGVKRGRCNNLYCLSHLIHDPPIVLLGAEHYSYLLQQELFRRATGFATVWIFFNFNTFYNELRSIFERKIDASGAVCAQREMNYPVTS